MKTNPNLLPQAIGLSSRRHAAELNSSGSSAGGSTSKKHSGSSAPAPKGTSPSDASTLPAAPTATVSGDTSCNTATAAHATLASSNIPELRKLAQYESLCGSTVFQRSSFFIPTASTSADAQASARDVAGTLKAYASAGIAPVVIMEPDDVHGNNLDLSQYANGTYDSALDSFFSALKSNGVTDAMMGMWVLLPEGNTPAWSTTDPTIFGKVVTKTAQFQKQYFPGSQSSIMLDSESYAPGAGWGNGSYASLVPYVQGIPKGLIDSFGLQGFPWAAPANQPTWGSLYNPATYLRTDLAAQAAQTLGTTNIWLNTGTFGQMYSGVTGQTVNDTPAHRQQMLEGVIQLTQKLKAQGFSVSIHLFAQNKSKVSEATDWSYWQNTPGDSPSTAVFSTFAHDAIASGIPLWLYDTL